MSKQKFFQGFWQLFKGYWSSEEKWRARGLLGVVIILNFATVYILVLLNQWYNTFYNALQEYRYNDFWPLIGQFALLAFIHIVIAVYAIYLRQMLQIKWRRWLTKQYLEKWLDKQTYYRIQVVGGDTDNPDQRISEDINQFVALTLGLALGFLKQATTLGAFIVILWQLSGIITVPIGGHEFTIYGYMVWFSLLYAIVGTYFTAKIGNPLVKLNYDQQRYEADFRFGMVRLRENSESVAFYGGELPEKTGFSLRFADVFKNYWSLMKYEKRLTWFTAGYGQLAIIVPILLAAPRYFAGEMQLGGLMQTNSAFGKVQDSLSFFVTSYTSIAQWTAVVKRLLGFNNHIQTVAELPTEVRIKDAPSNALEIDNLSVALPDGRTLLNNLSFTILSGDKLLITGESGCGKSTLLRTIAGIWPFGQGVVNLPRQNGRLFLPQRPYLPLGSLRQVVLYPAETLVRNDDDIREVLIKCALPQLVNRLDEVAEWSKILSLGEQQRIAFARLLLLRPNWVFLDEATSALDESTEKLMYELVAEQLPDTAVISIGHRNTLLKYHQCRLHLSSGKWELVAIK